MNKNTLARSLASIPLVIVAMIILGFGVYFYFQADAKIAEVNSKIESFEVLQDQLAEGLVTTRELNEIRESVEASERRALDYLGFYESLGIAVTVGGLVIAVFGAVATSVGISNYNDLLGELNASRDKYDDAQRQVSDNHRKANELLENLRTSRDDIQHEVERHIRQTWEKAHLALSLLPLAERQYQSGNVDGALDTYERAIDLDDSNPVPYYYKGYILTQKNQLGNAETALRKALELDDKFHHAQAALGYALRRLGEHHDDLEKRNEHYAEAEKLLKKALAENERLVDADGESWYGSLAGLYRRRGDIKQAEFYYERAAVVTPLSSYPAVNLAIIALERSAGEVNMRFERVEHLARTKITAVQENYWSYGDLLMAQLALGKNDVARETLSTFFEVIPEGVDDVLPRVKSSLELLRNATKYPDDKRNLDVINDVIARLDSEINPSQ